ncbi:MAG: MotA/TolQ/ExbB proton channel family protein [Pseudomonadota bacterium]|nr:MotA/TolQ/ExbB proton channel family protein [Pseudomonadota bacterium]
MDFALKINQLLLQANAVTWTVIAILTLMSLLTWYVIIAKTVQFSWFLWQARHTKQLFWRTASLNTLLETINRPGEHHPFAQMSRQLINAAIYYQKRQPVTQLGAQSEWLMRTTQRVMTEETIRLEAGLTLLAAIGNTAPFLGLLGTVLGIYNALITISAQGRATLATVAAPVGEALIMTAFGLAVAIPAVLGYNALVRGQRIFIAQLKSFAYDVHNCVQSGARMDIKQPHALYNLEADKSLNHPENA